MVAKFVLQAKHGCEALLLEPARKQERIEPVMILQEFVRESNRAVQFVQVSAIRQQLLVSETG